MNYLKLTFVFVLLLNFVLCNNAAAIAAESADPSGTFSNINAGSSSTGNARNDQMQSISDETLGKLLLDRMENPEKSSANKELYLKPKILSAEIKKALNSRANEKNNTNSGKYQITKTDKNLTVKDPITGAMVTIPRSSQSELMGSSPEEVLKSERMSNGQAATHSFKSSLVRLAPEAAIFYMGVGANHALNLITKYYENPMAFEQFAEELKNPISQMSFYMFMVGNQYGQIILSQALQNASFFRGALGQQLIGFLSMGVGSLLSSFSYDLLAATKPCAAGMASNNQDYKQQELAACQQAYKSLVGSDKMWTYASSMVSTMGSAVLSFALTKLPLAGAKSLAISGAQRIAPITFSKLILNWNSIKSVFKASKTLSIAVGGPITLGIRIFDFVIFLQLSEWLGYRTDYMLQQAFRSGPEFAELTKKLNQKLSLPNIMSCQYFAENEPSITLAWKGYMPERDRIRKSIRENNGICSPIDQVMLYQNASQQWRTAIESKFIKFYATWQQFLAEYGAMLSMDNEFLSWLVPYSADAKFNPQQKSTSYNPFLEDDPFFGVNLPEGVDPQKISESQANDFQYMNQLRAITVLQALPLIEKAISDIKNSGMATHPYYIQTQKALLAMRADILLFKNNPNPNRYPLLAAALEKLNSIYSDMGAYSVNMMSAQAVGGKADMDINAARMLRWRLSKIRSFVGQPLPLQRGNAFIYYMNNILKQKYESYLYTFEGKYYRDLMGLGAEEGEGTATDALIKLSVCGVDAETASRLDKHRGQWFYDKVNNLINTVNSWYNESFPMQWNGLAPKTAQTDGFLSENVRTQDVFHYGTGVDFTVPKIVKSDSSEICARTDVPIRLNSTRKITLKNGETYNSYLDYLLKNLDYEKFKNSSAGYATYFPTQWWNANVLPKIKAAFADFDKSYQELITHEFNPMYDENLYQVANNYKKTDAINAYITLLQQKSSRDFNGNPKNQAAVYMQEAETYLRILDKVYTSLVKNPNYAFNEIDGSDGRTNLQRAASQQINPSIAAFNRRLQNLRENLGAILYSVRADVPTIREHYAQALVDLTIISQTFLIHNDDVLNNIYSVPAIKKLSQEKAYPIYFRTSQRAQSDRDFADIFNQQKENFDNAVSVGTDVRPVAVYTLATKDKKLDDLALAFVTMNQLFDTFDEAYLKSTILKAATGEHLDKALEHEPQKQPGKIIGR